MKIEEFKKGITFHKSKSGLDGVIFNDGAKESLLLRNSSKTADNIASDFILRLNSNPDFIRDIKHIRGQYGIKTRKYREEFGNKLQLLLTTANLGEKKLNDYSKEYPDAIRELEKVADRVNSLASETANLGKIYNLSEVETGDLFEYVLFDKISGSVFIQVDRALNDDENYSLKIHKTVTPDDIRKLWPNIKEYLGDKPQKIKRKSPELIPELNFEIYKAHKKGLSNEKIVKKFQRFSLDANYVGKIIKKYEKTVPDKKP